MAGACSRSIRQGPAPHRGSTATISLATEANLAGSRRMESGVPVGSIGRILLVVCVDGILADGENRRGLGIDMNVTDGPAGHDLDVIDPAVGCLFKLGL